MKIIFKALSAALLFSMISGANADFMRCEGLTADQQTQADFCSAHIACKIAVKIMKSCADVTAYYADFFSETKGKSQEELARQTPPVEKEPEVAKVRYYSAEEIKQSRKDQISAYEKEDRELAAEMNFLI